MFVHLNVRSHYSFLRAVPTPQEIVAAAAELRMPAVALTDSNGLYAAVPFYQAARAAGVKPILGAVVDVGADLQIRPPDLPGRAKDRPLQFVLLAATLAGYNNLCALITKQQIEEKPLALEALNEHREGIIALFPGRSEIRWGTAPVPSGVEGCRAPTTDNELRGSLVTRHSSLVTLKDVFGDALYLEVQNLGPGDVRALREASRLGRELGVPLVATNHVHFLRPEEHLHHRVLNAIRANALLTTVAPPDITTAEAYFKSAEEMRRAFPDHPEALRATLEIAERCNLELPLGKTIFPEFPVPAGETPFSYLWKLCFEGARRRYRPVTPEVLARLTHELGVIEKLHLAPYFLLVWDIVEEAHRRDIPAVARGSAASSIVTYCLGISRVCPLRWGLYFERFLNEQRGDIPDIDLDICGARRDELLDYVYRRWGQEHVAPAVPSDRVAMIASFVTMHARLAVREVAKVFGLSPGEVNRFTRRLPHRPVREIQEAIRTLPECRALPANEEPWKTILDVARRLDDFPRHLGIHPCGTVIAAQPLTRLVPLEWATKGIVVTQYDMNAVEALGLIKMDLLGQRGLTTMSLALKNIEIRKSEKEKDDAEAQRPQRNTEKKEPLPNIESPVSNIDFDAIPEGDPATCSMIACGRTMGIFQIESPGMRGLLRALGKRVSQNCHSERSEESALVDQENADPSPLQKPSRLGMTRQESLFPLEDVCLALALIRPGASEYGSKETFLKRLRKQEPVRYPHPSLEPILRETLGICVYQEQVMQIAQAAGGLSLAESDLVRRASAKFADKRERERLHAKFLKAAERLGLTGGAREETWQMVEKFAGFGFCKAHAATYADLSYRIAYLKAHFPAEFLAAMCSSGAGFYHVSAYVEEAKRWGIEVRLPSVNHSRMEYTTEPLGVRKLAPALVRRSLLRREGEASLALPKRRQAAALQSALRIGLMQVKGLRAETIRRIVASREEHGPYRSLEDFLALVPVERDEIESLIKCGALDEVGQVSRPVQDTPTESRRTGVDACPAPGDETKGTGLEACPTTRPALLWRLNLLGAAQPAAAGEMLFPEAAVPHRTTEIPPLADYTRAQRLAYEQEILEVTVSGHPLDLVARNGEAWSTELERLRGKRVTLLGWVITFRHVGTKNYRNMMFVTLEDQRGVYEVVLFPEAYERYGGLVYETRALRVTGRVEPDGNINCEKLEKAENGK